MSNWLDIIPAIPLAKAVPLAGVDVLEGTVDAVCTFYNEHSERGMVNGGPVQDLDFYRVDLDDPQGFAYALRWLASRVEGGQHYRLAAELVARFVFATGEAITDADRVALARALAEVA